MIAALWTDKLVLEAIFSFVLGFNPSIVFPR